MEAELSPGQEEEEEEERVGGGVGGGGGGRGGRGEGSMPRRYTHCHYLIFPASGIGSLIGVVLRGAGRKEAPCTPMNATTGNWCIQNPTTTTTTII